MKKFVLPSILIALAIAGATITRAAISTGQQLQLSFKALDGADINIENYKGKYVVLDFWATWCGPCMGSMPKMIALNQKYHDKGLQIIGCSRDSDKQALERTIKDKNMDWPQWFDRAAVEAFRSSFEYRSAAYHSPTAIPFVVLVGKDGKVLYQGPPQALDNEVAKAFQNDPPKLDADKKESDKKD